MVSLWQFEGSPLKILLAILCLKGPFRGGMSCSRFSLYQSGNGLLHPIPVRAIDESSGTPLLACRVVRTVFPRGVKPGLVRPAMIAISKVWKVRRLARYDQHLLFATMKGTTCPKVTPKMTFVEIQVIGLVIASCQQISISNQDQDGISRNVNLYILKEGACASNQ